MVITVTQERRSPNLVDNFHNLFTQSVTPFRNQRRDIEGSIKANFSS
ncbi:MAG: hypothetical protein SAK42_02610 [Oscillatoria sp. PMC 1076.18]|nr:hypothetical protein [Oscillatoria sp. PMC 1076.18]